MDAVTAMNVPRRKVMDTGALKKFAQEARRTLRDQVSAKLVEVLAESSAARREAPKAVQQLESEIGRTSRDQVIERVAYTWFNRFTALRFMDANGYTAVRVVTPADGQTRPEILSEAMAGVIGDEVPEAAAAQIRALLDSRTPSPDPQGEAYRRLLVTTCNHWHTAMPFLFEKIDDFSELLMPKDLLSQTSILASLRGVMTDDACQDVEIIGWLYQFYISEKKDQVFAGLKKNQKITAENIPAATQLFTPHWIVRYLIENSLGRLWLLNRPTSSLAERMDYYIAPAEPETDFLRISRPEDIRICDPACGSGHMLTYAFDLLYAIYEEEGYEATEIPGLILKHNLTGVEIDDRAGALAAFALAMKAAAKLGRRRFLRIDVQPAIVVLQDVTFTAAEMQDVAAVVGRDLFTDDLRETLGQFEQAKNFGSLIVPKLPDPAEALRIVEARDFGGDLLLNEVKERVVTVLRMADALSPKYHVVVANPPYAGAKGLNPTLKAWIESRYPESKTDLMTCFMDRVAQMTRKNSYWGMINLPGWLFLSSYDGLRKSLLGSSSICLLLHLGRGLFGADFGAVAFIVRAQRAAHGYKGTYRRLFDRHVEVRSPEEIEARFFDKNDVVYRAAPADFEMIPGAPIAYWVSDEFRKVFTRFPPVSEHFVACQGLSTSSSPTFVRSWFEVQAVRTAFPKCGSDISDKKWFPYNKGGEFRKWSGNKEYVVNWEHNGRDIKALRPKSVVRNETRYLKRSVSWSDVTAARSSFRIYEDGFIFANNAHSAFPISKTPEESLIAVLNSKVVDGIVNAVSPGMHFDVGYFSKIPFQTLDVSLSVEWLISAAKSDWDAYETSWDFTALPLLSHDHRADTLAATYSRLRAHWASITEEMQRLEEENNQIFIDAYGLQNELTPEVPVEEITLTCNSAYRYGMKGSEEDRERRLLADTMAEFLSYAVGCMFGRYSLDAPGLILANPGDGVDEYLATVPDPTFAPDPDNVIPILDGDWFADDITERFRKFLRVTFGDAHFQENLSFVEEAVGKKLRSYFTRDFYADHLKRYKKRPIYWLFSSPKGTFNALIYMHRYRPDTVSVVLNDYLREFRNKLEGYRRAQEALSISGDASSAQKTKALKEIESTGRQIEELDAWERDVLFPLATQKIEIDLDDGVKVNYAKFGAALKPVKGLNDADD